MSVKVRDPVHNFVHFSDNEARLFNTASLQRLRGIRQLAMASLVYPGAVHTRFDHTLGVTHLAGLMAESLKLDPESVELVRLSSLLHDIGHGPFSHVSETALIRYAEASKLKAGQKQDKIHELITAHLILNTPEIIRLLGQAKCERVVKLLNDGYGQPVMRSVVSGPLDADKQDYLLRDSRFCGVEYGAFDVRQLHRSLVKYGPPDEEILAIDPDGVHAVEQFALAKYYMTVNVYRHKVRLITDQMIVRSIVLGIEKDGIDSLQRLYAFDNSEGFFLNYAEYDDSRFMNEFEFIKKGTQCGSMLTRLKQRRLLKRVFQMKTRELAATSREMVKALSKPAETHRRETIESNISEILKGVARQDCAAAETIVHAYTIRSVRESAKNDEAGIQVDLGNGIKPFDACSTLFNSMNDSYIDEYVEVYAPVDWATAADRNRLVRDSKEAIKLAIENGCVGATGGAG